MICLFCNRPFSEHSYDTRDTCNFFLPVDDLHEPVRADESDARGTEPAGVASGDAQGQEDLRGITPPHRVVQREVIDWANSLNGQPPVGDDISRLIQSLTTAIETDRKKYAPEILQRLYPLCIG